MASTMMMTMAIKLDYFECLALSLYQRHCMTITMTKMMTMMTTMMIELGQFECLALCLHQRQADDDDNKDEDDDEYDEDD